MEERYARSAAAMFSMPLLVFAVEMFHAAPGRGGIFAFVIAVLAGLSVAVLLWIAISGLSMDRRARL